MALAVVLTVDGRATVLISSGTPSDEQRRFTWEALQGQQGLSIEVHEKDWLDDSE